MIYSQSLILFKKEEEYNSQQSQVISEFPFDDVLANLQFSNSSHSNFEFPLVNSHTSEISEKKRRQGFFFGYRRNSF